MNMAVVPVVYLGASLSMRKCGLSGTARNLVSIIVPRRMGRDELHTQ